MFAARDESTETLTEADLRLPADALNRFREPVDAALDVLGHFGRMPIRPRAFDQGAPGAAVAGLGDAALATRRAARVLRRNQPDERRQLPRRASQYAEVILSRRTKMKRG